MREIRFEGRFDPELFRDFAVARARLLAVEITDMSVSEHCFSVRLVGEEALLGMFEMACLLGPTGCIVTGTESLG